MKKLNCIVGQSGGPTAAINASLAGVVSAINNSDKYDICYGAIRGILGILNEQYLNLSERFADSAQLARLQHTPAMYLGSCRYKLPDYKEDVEPYKFIFDQFEKLNIGAFFYIGGNDSMDTVMKLTAYAKEVGSDVRIIGIPKTIDNDLCMTDHTPGYGSAAKYIAASLLEIAHDTFIYAVKSVTIVEIMGRDAGWLTAASALARNEYNTAPHLIYLPEVPFSEEAFLEDVRTALVEKNNIIVAVSEGIRDKDGNYITASESVADQFGHQQLSGAGKALEVLVKKNLGVKVRSIEVNVLQRCSSHLASKTDLDESFAQGEQAVSFATEGITGSMVCVCRDSDKPYAIHYEYAPITQIANEAKSVPVDWISEKGNDVKQELLDYMRPLIQGEVQLEYQNGVPSYLEVTHLKPDYFEK